MEDFPCFANAEIQTVVNGPITYTPDILPMVLNILYDIRYPVGYILYIVSGRYIRYPVSGW